MTAEIELPQGQRPDGHFYEVEYILRDTLTGEKLFSSTDFDEWLERAVYYTNAGRKNLECATRQTGKFVPIKENKQ